MGTIGSALAAGLRAESWVSGVRGTTRSQTSAERARAELGIDVGTDNVALVRSVDVVFLCVKPHQCRAICEEIAADIGKRLVITTCAAIRTQDIRCWIGPDAAIVRAMPNTPCLVREGMIVLAAGDGVAETQLDVARKLFEPLGRTAVVEEQLFDGVTGLSGCGPAYVFLIIEALSEAGVKLGIPRKTSTLLAAQTLLGSAKMVLERDVHPAALKDEVTTPAGCTIDGLTALENGRLRSTLISGVVAAAERSAELRSPREK